MCKCTPEIRTPFCGQPECEDEYKDMVLGQVKTYTHRQHLFINDEGEIIVIRMSFDKERIFIRSINKLEHVNGLNGKPVRKYIPLDISLSNKSYEEIQALGV